ncbi:hypothetical protein METHPM2_370035 [Pseudomonas sp. PM2]
MLREDVTGGSIHVRVNASFEIANPSHSLGLQ